MRRALSITQCFFLNTLLARSLFDVAAVACVFCFWISLYLRLLSRSCRRCCRVQIAQVCMLVSVVYRTFLGPREVVYRSGHGHKPQWLRFTCSFFDDFITFRMTFTHCSFVTSAVATRIKINVFIPVIACVCVHPE